MEEHSIHNLFVEALVSKIPKKTMLAEFVAETLCIEKETAYRRLRGEVQFSLREAGLLAGRLNISLDEILFHITGKTKDKMGMYLSGHSSNPADHFDYAITAISYLEEITQEDYSEFGVAMSGIPYSLYFPYPLLSRFYLLKYLHHAKNSQHIPFDMMKESDIEIQFRNRFYTLFRNISSTYYIWDRHIMYMLVSDIKYANSIRIIKEEDVVELKKELFHFLNDLEQLATKGVYEETGNKFELYISDAHIDVTYGYIWTEKKYVSLIVSFVFCAIASEEEASFKNINEWVKSLKRFSTLVSGIGERERILFFEEQRAIVNTL